MNERPIEVWFWPTPNGHKITIALEEMALPYVLKPVNINKGEQFAPAFMAISPNNKIPAIVDPDGPDSAPISIFESGAILQYLGRKSGKLYPSDERRRVEVDQWLIWQVANVGPMSGQASHFINYAAKLAGDPAQCTYGRQRYIKELNRLCGVADRRLVDQEFLAGDYSVADIAAWPWLRGADKRGQSFEDFPNLKRWVDQIAQRPAVRSALAKGEAARREALLNVAPNPDEEARNLFGQTAASVADSVNRRSSQQD
jgi:glutathione S-transferase/GST-like protein